MEAELPGFVLADFELAGLCPRAQQFSLIGPGQLQTLPPWLDCLSSRKMTFGSRIEENQCLVRAASSRPTSCRNRALTVRIP